VITIVSGVPRSGTSLLMQMLSAGGMPILADGERIADADNPRGYFEWEPIKLLPRDPTVIIEAEGNAIKVVSQLLFALPSTSTYKIIFMRRSLPEVVASQAEMIRRRGQPASVLSSAQMVAALDTHLKQVQLWLQNRSHISAQNVEHRELITDPKTVGCTIAQYLGVNLDIDAMVRQVDASLYRQRLPLTCDRK
jgi:hypothetical protein